MTKKEHLGLPSTIAITANQKTSIVVIFLFSTN